MTSLNQIPDNLRDRRYDVDNWSPGRALVIGSVWTGLTAILIGALSCVMGYYAPALATHWALAAVGTFVVTSILHAVMHHSSNMVTSTGNAIAVLLAAVILVGTSAAVTARFAALASPPTTLWATFAVTDLFFQHTTAWVGLLAAAFCCKDGDTVFGPLFGFLSRNAITGSGG